MACIDADKDRLGGGDEESESRSDASERIGLGDVTGLDVGGFEGVSTGGTGDGAVGLLPTFPFTERLSTAGVSTLWTVGVVA